MEEAYSQLRRDLRRLARETIRSEDNWSEFSSLIVKLGLTESDILDKVEEYTFSRDISNDDYGSATMRIALHLHNTVRESYHQRRQEVVTQYLRECFGPPSDRFHPDRVSHGDTVDVGFGVPQRYVFELYETQGFRITFADKDPIAQEFARELLREKGIDVNPNTMRFIDYDMNDALLEDRHSNYLFLDSIEHCDNPTDYLGSIVRNAYVGSSFIFALPIGPAESIEKMHSIEWLEPSEAIKWLENGGLDIEKCELILPNPRVDIFARIYDRNFRNLLVKSRKNKR